MKIQPPLANYNPNERWRVHTVQIVLQEFEYRSVHTVEVGGNTCGFSVFDAAIDFLHERLYNEALENNVNGDLESGEDPYVCVILTDPEGNECETGDDENRQEEWLKDLVVSITIIKTEVDERE